jgi:hypothetical protein
MTCSVEGERSSAVPQWGRGHHAWPVAAGADPAVPEPRISTVPDDCNSTPSHAGSGNGLRDVILVVLAGLIGFGGAWLGSYTTIATERDQARESRQAEARTKRAATYSELLKTSGRYSAADLSLRAGVERMPEQSKGRCRASKSATCGVADSVFAEWIEARRKFGDALDQVYIYGSPRAVGVAQRLAATLPSTVNDEKGLPDYKISGDLSGYHKTKIAFLNVMCSEVSADPRPTC